MNVYLSYAVGPIDAAIPARLRAVAAAYDISILLPDRTTFALPSDAINKIKQSDAVIALATVSADSMMISLLNQDLLIATQERKPIISLVEEGMPFQADARTHVVYFNRYNYARHEASLINVLSQLRNEKKEKNLTALGWIAGIALGLVALSALIDDKE